MNQKLLYLTALQIVSTAVAVGGLVLAFSPAGLAVSLALFVLFGGVGMSVTYHRRLAHRAFRTSPFWEWVGTGAGFLGSHMSPVEWAAQHFNHHRYVDQPGDPHSPALLGWRAALYAFHGADAPVPRMFLGRLLRQRPVEFFHRHGPSVALLHLALCAVFGLPGIIYGFALPIALTHFGLILSVFNHGLDGPATRGWLNAILTMGEHNHAAHHRNATDVSQDGPATWIINRIRTDT
ncbi:hypothetical protein GTQ45_02020 [Pyruvatibacter mobilis]|uniref:Fatty acid desaturase n=1 Tax=Pyruvatibacter mobilis TaxID=1712261 RepID=A0A845Q8A5_9HYPH|nr:fatty acid desaturase [Pyruvatibacter mobilis]NBG94508.1 hypothetical protein [Pyruvatibacter mobilis]QJD74028.1 hypothetical protein HG718_00570 [Pyruvatibacter mobilis]GGD03505.1 fatty acid desaturase [Pyruvatibacter mobilis]